MEELVDLRAMRTEEGAELFELAPGETSLSLLQKIYRSSSQPIARRMRAAMAALQHEHPKLTAMAIDSMDGASFAAMLDRAIERSKAPPKLIEHKADETTRAFAGQGHSPAQREG
jgi:hypothetical protein